MIPHAVTEAIARAIRRLKAGDAQLAGIHLLAALQAIHAELPAPRPDYIQCPACGGHNLRERVRTQVECCFCMAEVPVPAPPVLDLGDVDDSDREWEVWNAA